MYTGPWSGKESYKAVFLKPFCAPGDLAKI